MQYLKFTDAVKFAKQILENWIYDIIRYNQGLEVYRKGTVLATKTGSVIVMDGYCSSWINLSEGTDIKWALHTDPEGVALVTIDAQKYPIEISEDEQEHEDFIFLHKAKFIAKFTGINSAIRNAKKL